MLTQYCLISSNSNL